MSNIFYNEKYEVSYPEDLFSDKSEEEIDNILTKLKEYYIVCDAKEVFKNEHAVIYENTILKTAYFSTHKVYDKIYCNQKSEKFKGYNLPQIEWKDKKLYALHYDGTGYKSIEDCYNFTYEYPKIEAEKKEFNVSSDGYNKQTGSKKYHILSDEGNEYWNTKMDEICKDDHKDMREAIWFIRMEINQRKRGLEIALDNTSFKYGVDRDLLYRRFQSNLVVWRWAKKK